MTDREFVLSVYPGAKVNSLHLCRLITDGGLDGDELGSAVVTNFGNNEELAEAAAWASAAKRIREQQAKGKEVGNG